MSRPIVYVGDRTKEPSIWTGGSTILIAFKSLSTYPEYGNGSSSSWRRKCSLLEKLNQSA
jgi:hypothetical protein